VLLWRGRGDSPHPAPSRTKGSAPGPRRANGLTPPGQTRRRSARPRAVCGVRVDERCGSGLGVVCRSAPRSVALRDVRADRPCWAGPRHRQSLGATGRVAFREAAGGPRSPGRRVLLVQPRHCLPTAATRRWRSARQDARARGAAPWGPGAEPLVSGRGGVGEGERAPGRPAVANWLTPPARSRPSDRRARFADPGRGGRIRGPARAARRRQAGGDPVCRSRHRVPARRPRRDDVRAARGVRER